MSFALSSFELEESELNLREGLRGENTLQFIESRQIIVLNSIGWGENGEVLPLHNQEPVSLEESLKKPLKKRSQESERRKKKVGCTCCKTKCLKKYCDCFRNGNFCTAQCSCKVCFNTKEYEKHVKKAREAIKLKDAKKAEKGCNCKKSQCRKNYCRCFELGVGCTAACKCIDCANFDYSAYQQVRTSSVGLSKFMNEQD